MIIQVWISTHFGVLSEQLPVADENLLFIEGNFTRRQVSVKAIRALFGSLASRGLHQDGREQPRPVERGQPEFLSRFGWG